MSRNGKVIVAMSGGVDSSVAACLLKEQGYDCIGVFMRVGSPPEAPDAEACRLPASDASAGGVAAAGGRALPIASASPQRRLKHGCCSASDALDARVVAGKLGIPFYALNFEQEFAGIIDYFVDEYGRGRTPNPCVMCNIHLKFGKLLRYADMMDAAFVATGHYARALPPDDPLALSAGLLPGGAPAGALLARAANRAKDQSYVLFGVPRADLSRCLFPLGEFADKSAVRQVAAGLGLRVHDKPDSQEICFVPGDDYAALFDRRRPGERVPGPIRDAAGRELGQHAGYQTYTIGQRRGLGIAIGRPAYVREIDPQTNTVYVGDRDALLTRGLHADRVNWLVPRERLPWEASGWVSGAMKIRHMHAAAAGRMRAISDDRIEADFDSPQAAVTPGQAAVFYRGEIAVAGGWIQ